MELLILLAVLWLASPIALGIALVISRRRRRRAESDAPAYAAAAPAPGAAGGPVRAGVKAGHGIGSIVPRDVTSLVLLQLELERQRGSGGLADDEYQGLRRSLDAIWASELERDGYRPDSGKWRSRCDEAWGVLVRQLDEPPGPPPWRSEPTPVAEVEGAPAPAAQPVPDAPATPAPAHQARAERIVTPVRPVPVQAEPAPRSTPTAVVEPAAAARVTGPTGPADAWQRTSALEQAPMPRRDAVVEEPPGEPASAFAFAPALPSAFGKAIETLSGWPRLAAPFLAQNVGWFVGGFCFIAGTLFLVSVTTGYVNALVILASLAVYTGFLTWAGYAIRQKSPELRTSSNVLLGISMLLAPLNLTAGVHLVTAAIGSTPALALALALAAGQCAGLLVAARLVNALMDRALPPRHAQLFTALSALQLAAPLIAHAGHWLALAAAQTALLALVGWGLLAFAREWVRSIFLDRRLIAYYAAGLLVFAALVSFVLLTRAYPAPLPRGYFGPYLMALCALLFYLDAALKEWTKKHAFLSRFTFALYGLSVAALALCFDAPGPRIVSLVLAVAIYGQVLWRYSSVPGLYLLLGAVGWLYGSIVLEQLPRELHLLASLPGLAGLFALLRWTERRSVALATICLRAFGLVFVGLTAWSLFHGAPGAIAFATGAAATAGIAYALTCAPWLLRAAIAESSRDAVFHPAPWYYVVAALAAVTVAYAPTLPWPGRPDQLAFALLGLATVAAWIALGLRDGASTVRTEASLNSALILAAASVTLGALAAAARFPVTPSLALLLALAGVLLGWLSVELRAGWLFYGVLAALGLTALIVKRTYFHAPSFGLGEQIGVLALWVLVWWLDGRQARADAARDVLGDALQVEAGDARDSGASADARAVAGTGREGPRAGRHAGRGGGATMSASRALALRDVARTPLTQAMMVLWLIGAVQLVARLPGGVLELKWPVGVALAAFTALVLLGSQRLLRLAALPVLLGLLATLAFAHGLGVDTPVGAGTVAAAYALCAWYALTAALAHPASGRVAAWLRLTGQHGAPGARALVESAAHWSGFAVCLVVVALVPLVYVAQDFRVLPGHPASWPMLALAGAFFFFTAWRYGHRSHCYALLVSVLLGVWLGCARVTTPVPDLEVLLGARALVLWTIVLSLAFSAAASMLDRLDGPGIVRARALYREPLRNFALGLALAALAHEAVLQAASLAISARPWGGGFGAGLSLLAGVAMLYANHARGRFAWTFLGVLVIWLALDRIAIDALVPDWRALRHGDAAHHALVLATLALAAASLARFLGHRAASAQRYASAIYCNAAIAFAAAVFAAGAALAGPAPGGSLLAVAMTLLVAGVMPLLGPLHEAERWRGLALPVLLTGFVSSVFAVPALDLVAVGGGALAWGFALWLGGNFVLERWNRRLPQWSIGGAPWPWFGLGFVLAGAAMIGSAPGTSWLALAGLSTYCYLMIRNSDQQAFPWIAAGALTLAGLVLCGWWTAVLGGGWRPITHATMFASVVWLNLLLAAVPAWRRHGASIGAWLGWRRNDIEVPLTAFTGAALLLTLAALAALEGVWALDATASFGAALHAGLAASAFPAPGLASLGPPALGLALAASFAHALRVRPHAEYAHAFLAALLALVIALVMVLGEPRNVPLALALSGAALLALWRVRTRARGASAGALAVDSAMRTWLAALPVAALALAVFFPLLSIGEQLLVFVVVLANAAGIGWWQHKKRWLIAAGLLALVVEHAIWLLWLPLDALHRALPWYALTGAANAVLILWAAARLERAFTPGATDEEKSHRGAIRALRSVLELLLPLTVALTLLELAVQLVWAGGLVAAGADAPGPDTMAHAATLASWAVLIGLAIRTARRRRQGRWIYAGAMLGGVAALYLRVVTIGLAPPGVIDTGVLIGAAYVLFAVQRLTRSAPTLNVCLVLPLLAVATLPAQVGSVHAGAALMAIAVLYLLIRGGTRNPIPLYLGVLALNASVYLWIPLWVDRLGIFQLYVMPAAVSVLALVHVHRRELKPSVLNGARLAALATLYCGAALDVFVHPSLGMFALALALSIVSVIIGIAFRIRAFLYGGVAFLVLNVGFQLLQLYPEQRLGRAVLLITLGITITGGMIGFNIKREAILQRIRIMRADLDTWE